jgi:hypothetical protein
VGAQHAGLIVQAMYNHANGTCPIKAKNWVWQCFPVCKGNVLVFDSCTLCPMSPSYPWEPPNLPHTNRTPADYGYSSCFETTILLCKHLTVASTLQAPRGCPEGAGTQG